MNTNYLNILKDDLLNLKKMNNSLEIIYKRCIKIDLNKVITDKENILLDSLTSRFSRLSDIVLQKILRTIDIINLEDAGTIRDRLNRAEKNELISSTEEFVEIRKLRNDITHEYLPEDLINIYKQVLKYSPLLKDFSNRILKYSKNKYGIY